MTPPTPFPGQELELARQLNALSDLLNNNDKWRELHWSVKFLREAATALTQAQSKLEVAAQECEELAAIVEHLTNSKQRDLSRARAEAMEWRNALEIIADWDHAPITGEHRESLLDIIRSITDCARRALSQSPESEPVSQPDWPPPQRPAMGLDEGVRKLGSTGQLWEVRGQRWVRVPRSESGSAGAPRAMLELANTTILSLLAIVSPQNAAADAIYDGAAKAQEQIAAALHSPRPKEE